MKPMSALLLAATIAIPAAPALALDAGASRSSDLRSEGPSVLSASERSNYRAIFAAIHSGDWAGASARLAGMRDGPLHAAATAEIYLAKGSPVVSMEQALNLLREAPYLPQAAQLGRLAQRRGATSLPDLPRTQDLVWAGSQPRRSRADSVANDPVAQELDAQIQPLIVDDQPAAAEALLNARAYSLSPDARTEFQQRIAWSYYLT
jgi:hypothetical protein